MTSLATLTHAKSAPLMGVKRCPACATHKPFNEFYSSRADKNNCSAYCKPCENRLRVLRPSYGKKYQRTPLTEEERRLRYAKRWADRGPEGQKADIRKRFENHIRRTFGLSMDDARAMLASQNGLCAIAACREEISLDVHGREPGRAVIDHCHTTGRVRGLLCQRCNKAEGFFAK